jgi:hypothetical protein
MASTPIIRQYTKAVFIDKTRTNNSVPVSLKAGVMEYAGTSTTTPQFSPQVYLEDINDALAAETITQGQYDQLLTDYPNIPNRPVYQLTETAPTV